MSTLTAPIECVGDGYSIGLAPDAETMKAMLLKSADKITAVTDSDGSLVALSQIKAITRFLGDVEKSRTAAKAPSLDFGRKVDSFAKEFVASLEATKKRLNDLVAGYAAEQQRKQREAEKLQREQEAAAEKARLEAERKQREVEYAERARLDAEVALASAKTKEEQEAADLAFDAADAAARQAAVEAEAHQGEQEAADIAHAKATIATMRAAAPIRGVKPTLDFEVDDIVRLYEFAPALVDITPRRRDILDRLKAMQERGETVAIPGLRIVEKFTVQTR